MTIKEAISQSFDSSYAKRMANGITQHINKKRWHKKYLKISIKMDRIRLKTTIMATTNLDV